MDHKKIYKRTSHLALNLCHPCIEHSALRLCGKNKLERGEQAPKNPGNRYLLFNSILNVTTSYHHHCSIVLSAVHSRNYHNNAPCSRPIKGMGNIKPIECSFLRNSLISNTLRTSVVAEEPHTQKDCQDPGSQGIFGARQLLRELEQIKIIQILWNKELERTSRTPKMGCSKCAFKKRYLNISLSRQTLRTD
jgi:hypothetical protein